MIREQRCHVGCNLVDLLVRLSDLDAEVVNAVDVKALVHELLPEIHAVVGCLDDFVFELDELLLEVIDLYDIEGRLVGEQVLVLAVHDVLN